MCAYTERDMNNQDALFAFLEGAGLGEYADSVLGAGMPDPDGIQRSRPAFGGNARARLNGMIARVGDRIEVCNPIWWFDLEEQDGELHFGKRTSFNARHLHYPLWREAVKSGRALFLATAIGEAKKVDKTTHRYRMVSKKPFLLGGLVKPVGNDYAAAIITRDSHPRFDEFHDKAFPMFVPSEEALDWLAQGKTERVEERLNHPRLVSDFTVTPVKTYGGAEATGTSVQLRAD